MKNKTKTVWSQTNENIVFVIYMLGLFVMFLVMLLYQPHIDPVSPVPMSPPDESNRMLIPQFIYNHGTLPTGLEEEVRIQGCGFSYGLYNILPYIFQGLFMRLVGLFTTSDLALLYAARSVNMFFGMLMAWVVYKLGLRLFKDPRFRWLFCFAVMYLPESLFVHTYVNTDSCCMLSTAMILYALVWAYQENFNYKNCIWLALGIILCSLSYYNAYGYILCSILLFVAFYLQKENNKWSLHWKEMLHYGLFITAIVLVGAGWWFIRAYFVLDGDILGLKTKEQLALLYAIEATSPLNTYSARGISVYQMLKENQFFQCLYDSFIAAYGSLSIRGNYWTYLSYKLFFAAGILGLVTPTLLSLIHERKLPKFHFKKIFFHFNMILCMLLPLIIMIRYAYTMDYQHQGRYILPSLIPIMYYTVRGIEKLTQIKLAKSTLPGWLISIGIAFALFIAIGSAFFMVFMRALPVYLEMGMML